MPSALLRPCGEPGCAELTAASRCAAHTRTRERSRVAAKREAYGTCNYNTPDWRWRRDRFRRLLIAADVLPVCGARLPGAPMTHDSRCQVDGRLLGDDEHRRLTGQRLTVDHIVPHRGDVALFRDELNYQLLCESDANRKSEREKRERYTG